MAITFNNADIKFTLPDKAKLKSFMAKQTKKKLSLSYVFCSDEYLIGINQQFLAHDFYTDIITFPLSETEKEIEAEIYISIDRVKDNAQKLAFEFKDELHRVMFHGVLHLLGFKDKTKAQKAVMRAKENELLKKWSRTK